MTQTRTYKTTVRKRIQKDKRFATALHAEALNALADGETELGLSMLRDQATVKITGDVPAMTDSQACARVDDALKRVVTGERIVLARRGKAVAALASVEDAAYLDRLESKKKDY
jgi:prevent-host-death family protein